MPELLKIPEEEKLHRMLSAMAARSLLGLIDRESQPENLMGMETAVSVFEPIPGTTVRVATIQDWSGDTPNPELKAVVTTPDKDAVRTTEYNFWYIDRLLRSGYYKGDAEESLKLVDRKGQETTVILSGRTAVDAIAWKVKDRKQRNLLSRAASGTFNEHHYIDLAMLVKLCGVHNKVNDGKID